MPLMIKINSKDFFLANLTFCSHLLKTMSSIKNKLTPKKFHMFKKIMFGHFLDGIQWTTMPLHFVERGGGET